MAKIKNNLNLFDISNNEDLYMELSNGKITVKDLINKVEPKEIIDDIEDETLTEKFIRKARGIAKGVKVGGISNTLINYGKCCNPIPGDEIIGYVTQGRGVTIHRVSCKNYPVSSSNRLITVEWDISNNTSFMVRLKIEGEDRKDLAKDIIDCTSNLNMNISSVNMTGDSGLARCMIVVEVRDILKTNK